jgi:L-ascorbate metabolism protein UlaG (beta-lactamase superfamily)
LATALALAGVLAGCSAKHPTVDPSKPHHRPEGFVNLAGAAGGKPLSAFLRWQWERLRDGLPKPPAVSVAGDGGFPVVRPDLALLSSNAERGEQVTVTWIGHATLFLQIGGANVLVDPIFSARASPLSFAGPRRRVALPARLDELPRVDLVLISHNHYDHLDAPTVRALQAQPGGPPRFVVPLGIDAWLRAEGVSRVERLDWWDTLQVGPLEIVLTPAQHWSSRTPFDRNATLWGGFAVKAPGFTFWYSGDTGYAPLFEEIGRRVGPIDLAAIPVGAYEPRWFMKDQHVNPDEAVRIFREVGAREAIGVHWGTFELTDEPLDAPIDALAAALDAQGVPRDRFMLYRHGETRTLRREAVGDAQGTRSVASMPTTAWPPTSTVSPR